MSITRSFPKVRPLQIGRIKRDPVSITLVFAENNVPQDLAGKDIKLIFSDSGNDHVYLSKEPTQIDSNIAVFDIHDTDKNKIFAQVSTISICVDNVTIAKGTFTWTEELDLVSKNPTAIGVNYNTLSATVEWFDVVVGPKGATGKSSWQYAVDEGYTGTEEEFSYLMAGLTTARDEAQGYAGNAQGYAESAGLSAGIATTKAGEANTSAQNAATSEGNAHEYAQTAVSARDEAVPAAVAAVNARNEAVPAASTAVQAKNDAVQAKDDAVIAKNAAGGFAEDAEDARNEVEAIKDSFIRNSSDTFGVKTNTIVGLTKQEYIDLPLKLNTTMYVTTDAPTPAILQVVTLTQAEYDSIPDPDPEVLFAIPKD